MSIAVDSVRDTIEVVDNDVTLLQYQPETPASKPFVEKVALPGGAGDLAGRNLVLSAPHDHAWHLGLFFCQKLIDGINCWESELGDANDTLHGRALNRGVEIHEEQESVRIEQAVAWKTNEGTDLLSEDRSIMVMEPGVIGPADSYLIQWETTLQTCDQYRTIGSESLHGHYSGLSARFARELDSGRILLPDGVYDGEGANGSDAPWCDYTGSLDGHVGTIDSPTAGLAFFDDPCNQPGSRWFTMTEEFGFVSANPTWSEVRIIEPDDPLSFRWGVWVHTGTPDEATIDRVYQVFTDRA